MTIADRLNGWAKPLATMLIPLLAVAVAWGVMRGDVNALQREAADKPSRAEIQALTREVQYLRDDIRELRQAMRGGQ